MNLFLEANSDHYYVPELVLQLYSDLKQDMHVPELVLQFNKFENKHIIHAPALVTQFYVQCDLHNFSYNMHVYFNIKTFNHILYPSFF